MSYFWDESRDLLSPDCKRWSKQGVYAQITEFFVAIFIDGRQTSIDEFGGGFWVLGSVFFLFKLFLSFHHGINWVDFVLHLSLELTHPLLFFLSKRASSKQSAFLQHLFTWSVIWTNLHEWLSVDFQCEYSFTMGMKYRIRALFIVENILFSKEAASWKIEKLVLAISISVEDLALENKYYRVGHLASFHDEVWFLIVCLKKPVRSFRKSEVINPYFS